MILADKIITERKKNGWSQEELADMLGVSRQSVSKWEGAQAVPDLQKILKLAEIFGVSTDYLLKDEIEAEETSGEMREVSDHIPPLRKVTLSEVNEFIAAKKWETPRTAIATFLCITCPVLLIFMAGLSEIGLIKENLAVGIGLVALFVMIAVAVFMFIMTSNRMKKYDYFRNEDFETEYGVTGIIKEKKEAIENRNTITIAVGVVMCICACLPLIITALAEASDFIIVCMVCVLLVLIAVAVAIFINADGVFGAYKMILQEGEFTHSQKKVSKRVDPIMSLYWCLVTAGYLAYSFITNDWSRSWIVWPVAGVLCGAVSAIIKVVNKNNE